MIGDVVHLPGGRRIITCSADGSLRVWDLKSGAQIGDDWRDYGDKTPVFTVVLSPDGNMVASGSTDGTVRLWDIKKKEVITKLVGHTDCVQSMRWSTDGERLVSGSEDGTIRVWDVGSGKTVLGPIKTGYTQVYGVAYSPDETKIATGGYHVKDKAIKIWDAKTGELLFAVKHGELAYCLAWTSDGKKLISGLSDGSIGVFDTVTWQPIVVLDGHERWVNTISLSQSDRLVISASVDNTARLWNLDTNAQVGPPLQHEDALRAAAISIDGKLLVTCCDDKNAHVWDIHTILKDAGLEDLLSIPRVSVHIIYPTMPVPLTILTDSEGTSMS
jgi:WD40 repeat protein